jgi:hypothetical protein
VTSGAFASPTSTESKHDPKVSSLRHGLTKHSGRADWTWISTQGRVKTMINQRNDGQGMIPYWRDAGWTYGGMGEEIGDSRENIQFARIYGSGRSDYVYIKRGKCGGSSDACGIEIKAWENTGNGGRMQRGDGVFFGDMRGRGIDDYLWIDSTGVVNFYPNLNSRSDTTKYAGSQIPWGPARNNILQTGLHRRALHVADWDGDGKDDIIGYNNNDFTITVWKNNWDGSNFNFARQSVNGGPYCREKRGLGYNDQPVHFADISGEGKADLLCMQPSGRVTGWINDDSYSMRSVGQVKFSQELDRANYQFADVDGDGLADLIHTDKFNGNGRVWYNMGEKPESERDKLSGSKFEWREAGIAYNGWTRGHDEHFPSLQGQGRADLVKINPKNGHGWVSFNTCPPGGDDLRPGESPPNPRLPTYSPPPQPDGEGGGPGNDDDPQSGEQLCSLQVAEWTKNAWNDFRLGDWFQNTMDDYGSNGWPSLGSNKDSIPEAIAKMNGRETASRETTMEWPGECKVITGTCDLERGEYYEQCGKDSWQRSFVLFALGNLSRFLQRYRERQTDAEFRTSLRLGELALTFIPGEESEEGVSFDEANWLGVFAGLMAAMASAVPAAGIPAGFASGILTMAQNMVGGSDTILYDPRFTNYLDLTSKFAEATDAYALRMRDYHRHLFDTRPGSAAHRNELVSLVQSGDFCDQDVGLATRANGGIEQETWQLGLQTGLINTLWRQQKVFVLQLPRGKFTGLGFRSHTFDYDPCFDVPADSAWRDAMGNKIWCDGQGNNWFILGWGKSNMVKYYGTSLDDLQRYDLDREYVIQSARRSQDMMRGFRRLERGDLRDFYRELAADPRQVRGVRDLVRFNLPVCDLGAVDVTFVRDNCYIFAPVSGSYNFRWDECFADLVMRHCAQYSTYGESWPWSVDDE